SCKRVPNRRDLLRELIRDDTAAPAATTETLRCATWRFAQGCQGFPPTGSPMPDTRTTRHSCPPFCITGIQGFGHLTSLCEPGIPRPESSQRAMPIRLAWLPSIPADGLNQ